MHKRSSTVDSVINPQYIVQSDDAKGIWPPGVNNAPYNATPRPRFEVMLSRDDNFVVRLVIGADDPLNGIYAVEISKVTVQRTFFWRNQEKAILRAMRRMAEACLMIQRLSRDAETVTGVRLA